MKSFAWILGTALVATSALAQYGPTQVPQPPDAGARAGEDRPYEVTGVVRSVDRTRGALELAADGETFTLRYPPSALAGISPGDRVTARMTIMRAAEGTSTKGAGSFATEPETGSPGVRPPGAER